MYRHDHKIQKTLMRYVFMFFLLLTQVVISFSQTFTPDLKTWGPSTIKKAHRISYNLFCSKRSNEVVFYINLARMDGKKFIETIIKPYLDYTGNTEDSYYLQSLIKQLTYSRNLPPLKHNLRLEKMGKSYAEYAGKNGIVGHSFFLERFNLLTRRGREVGENCAYGIESPLGIVIELLIDEGEENLGHRLNLLSTSFHRIGIGIALHSTYGINCVQEFSN